MPRKTDKIKISGTEFDKRVKLFSEDKENIRRLYFVEKKGIREIARIYDKIVCRRTIQFILFPERLVKSRENRDWTRYYDRKNLTKSARELRQRKKNLYEKGLLFFLLYE